LYFENGGPLKNFKKYFSYFSDENAIKANHFQANQYFRGLKAMEVKESLEIK
jgi:hypothetical protein